MNRSALPLVCGRYGLVNLCCTPKALQAAANSLDRKGTPLSVSRRDAYAQPRVVRHRVVDGFVLLLLAMHGDEVDARVVVDGHKQRLPAWTLDRVAPVASHSTTGSDDAPELLGVDARLPYRHDADGLHPRSGDRLTRRVLLPARAAEPGRPALGRHIEPGAGRNEGRGRPAHRSGTGQAGIACVCLSAGVQQEPMIYGCEQAGYLPRSKEGSGRTAVASCSVLTSKPRILEQLQTPQIDLSNHAWRQRSRIATCQRCLQLPGNGPVNSACTFYTGTNPRKFSCKSKINKLIDEDR